MNTICYRPTQICTDPLKGLLQRSQAPDNIFTKHTFENSQMKMKIRAQTADEYTVEEHCMNVYKQSFTPTLTYIVLQS